MANTLLGLPVEVWAAICFAVAAAYTVFWPRPPRTATVPRSALAHVILRWLHAATWIFLGLAALALKYIDVNAAKLLGVLGLISYLVFMTYFLREKLRYPQG